jgi:hypothetical protein
MNYQDVNMLNSSIANLGNSFDQSRAEDAAAAYRNSLLDEQKKRTALDDSFRQEQLKRLDNQATNATKPVYKWKSKGVDFTAHSLEDFGKQVQQYPADQEDDGSTDLEMAGTNEHGITFRQKIKVPKDAAANDGAKQSAAAAIKAFADMTGSAPKPQKPTATQALLIGADQYRNLASQSDDPDEAKRFTDYADMLEQRAKKDGQFAPPKVTPTVQKTIQYNDAGKATNIVTAPVGMPPVPAAATSFSDENAARAAGHKAGDVVTLAGIGKVRLK